jgi:hypothetical protein
MFHFQIFKQQFSKIFRKSGIYIVPVMDKFISLLILYLY